VSAGRKKDEVAGVLERLSNCDGVEAVSMDMSTTFREAVQLCLPRARIVADHFHVIQRVNKALNKVISRWAKTEEGSQPFAIGGRKFWPSLTFCRHVSLVAMPIDDICDCVSCWRWPHEFLRVSPSRILPLTNSFRLIILTTGKS
jgi:Transposase